MNELGLLYRFLPTELAPPEDMWSRLVKVLDNDKQDAFNKMEMLEMPPPASAWENILAALEEHEKIKTPLSFADTCLQMELATPPFAWNKIEGLLATETPVKQFGTIRRKTEKLVAIALAIAACLTGIVFFVGNKTVVPNNTNTIENVATINKASTATQPIISPIIPNKNDTEKAQKTIAHNDKIASFFNPLGSTPIDYEDDERQLNLEKTKQAAVPLINTTNNKVASLNAKPRDANGNLLTKISDYFSKEGFVVVTGPNGNSVNLSSKLIDIVPFLQEDSTNAPEEYLDKVMRESNIWRQKLIDWKKKVDAADADPSKMNFIDPIDLMRFLQKNK